MYQDFIISIISSATVSTLFASGLIWLTKSWISTRLKNSIQHEYEQKLESYKATLKAEHEIALAELKADLEKGTALHIASHTSFSQGQKAAMERKLIAVDKLWESILSLRNSSPAILTFVDLLTPIEFKSITSNKEFNELLSELSPEKIIELMKNIEEIRPYVGEYTWSLFFVYQTITLRIVFLLYMSRVNAENVEWFNDQGIKQLMRVVLYENEISEFNKIDFGKINWLRQTLEQKIINSVNKVISGEEFGEEALKQANKILAETNKIKVTVKPSNN